MRLLDMFKTPLQVVLLVLLVLRLGLHAYVVCNTDEVNQCCHVYVLGVSQCQEQLLE